MKTLKHTVNNSVDISTACLILFNNIAKREPIAYKSF